MKAPNNRPTLRDVAAACGVSHMTVCRVIRQEKSVAPHTARRVRAMIEELGYRPDPALSALAAYRSPGSGHGSVIAFLECENTAYSEQARQGATSEARLLGYDVQAFPLAKIGPPPKQLARTLYHRGIKGVLLGPCDEERDLRSWDWSHFTSVSIGALSHRPRMNAVCMNYFDAAMRAVQYLRTVNSQRPALIVIPHLEARTGHQWKGGFLAEAGEHGLILSSENYSRRLLAWFKKYQFDGVATIHAPVWDFCQKREIPCIFLNEYEAPKGAPRFSLAPELIGSEALRMLHHQLLRGGGTAGGTMTAMQGQLQP